MLISCNWWEWSALKLVQIWTILSVMMISGWVTEGVMHNWMRRSWVATQKPFNFSQIIYHLTKGFCNVPHQVFLVCLVAIPEIFAQTQVSDY